jgi:hypothetical protein
MTSIIIRERRGEDKDKDESRDWSYVAISQRMPGVTISQARQGNILC